MYSTFSRDLEFFIEAYLGSNIFHKHISKFKNVSKMLIHLLQAWDNGKVVSSGLFIFSGYCYQSVIMWKQAINPRPNVYLLLYIMASVTATQSSRNQC